MVGILVTRGSRLSIPVGGAMFGIGPDGSLTGSITLHVSYDMYPQWLVQFRNSKQVSNSVITQGVERGDRQWSGRDRAEHGSEGATARLKAGPSTFRTVLSTITA